MVKINYEPSEVLISPREPYNKNTVWIHPMKDNIEIKIYDSGWRIIAQTKDIGLSNEAKNQVEEIAEELRTAIVEILKKQFGKFSSNNNILYKKYKSLEERIENLEDRFDRLNKKYSTFRKNGK